MFVADFIGSPSMNLLDVTLERNGDNLCVRGSGFNLKVPDRRKERYAAYQGKEIVFGIRPQHVNESSREGDGDSQRMDAVIEVVEPLGTEIILSAKCGENSLTASVDTRAKVKADMPIEFRIDMNQMHLFDKTTHKVI
jgi:multiple sugar transport system ATP-binding protein